MHAVPAEALPNMSAMQALTIAGSKMSTSEKLAPQLKKWLGQLAKWSDDHALEPRVRFKIKVSVVASS